MKNEIINSILEKLDGKDCRIKSGALVIEGGMEINVRLKYKKHFGLQILSTLKWNNIKPYQLVLPILNQHLKALSHKENEPIDYISFDARDQIHEKISKAISECYIQLGNIYPSSIEKIETCFNDKGEITEAKIFYPTSQVIIYCIKEPK